MARDTHGGSRSGARQSARRDELLAESPAVDADAAELDAADRAVPVGVALAAAEQRARELASSRAAEQAARDQVAVADGPATADPTGLREQAAACRTELGRLEVLAGVQQRAEDAEARVGAARAESSPAGAASGRPRLRGGRPRGRAHPGPGPP
jgi:hypothetical protein